MSSKRVLPALALLALAATLLLAFSHSASAALLVYEPFDYADGTELAGSTATGLNLTGTYTTDSPPTFPQLTAASPGLGYGSLIGVPASVGNRLTEMNGVTSSSITANVDQDVLVAPGSAIYWSALFTLNDVPNANRFASITFTSATGEQLTFGETVVGSGAILVSVETAATGGQFSAGADNAFEDGQTLLLVGRYVNSAVAGADTLELIGYGTAQPHVLPAAFDPGDPNAQFSYALDPMTIDFADMASITFSIRGSNNNFIDELRIGSTYAAVIPEPQTSLLVLAGLVFAGVLVAAATRRS